jgi:hypothetical protein
MIAKLLFSLMFSEVIHALFVVDITGFALMIFSFNKQNLAASTQKCSCPETSKKTFLFLELSNEFHLFKQHQGKNCRGKNVNNIIENIIVSLMFIRNVINAFLPLVM